METYLSRTLRWERHRVISTPEEKMSKDYDKRHAIKFSPTKGGGLDGRTDGRTVRGKGRRALFFGPHRIMTSRKFSTFSYLFVAVYKVWISIQYSLCLCSHIQRSPVIFEGHPSTLFGSSNSFCQSLCVAADSYMTIWAYLGFRFLFLKRV